MPISHFASWYLFDIGLEPIFSLILSEGTPCLGNCFGVQLASAGRHRSPFQRMAASVAHVTPRHPVHCWRNSSDSNGGRQQIAALLRVQVCKPRRCGTQHGSRSAAPSGRFRVGVPERAAALVRRRRVGEAPCCRLRPSPRTQPLPANSRVQGENWPPAARDGCWQPVAKRLPPPNPLPGVAASELWRPGAGMPAFCAPPEESARMRPCCCSRPCTPCRIQINTQTQTNSHTSTCLRERIQQTPLHPTCTRTHLEAMTITLAPHSRVPFRIIPRLKGLTRASVLSGASVRTIHESGRGRRCGSLLASSHL